MRYFFAVLAILTLLGVLNGLVLLPVLLSIMGPPAEVTPADNGSRLPTPSPEPLPPPMNHHGYYSGRYPPPPGPRRHAFSESEDSSEYYSETTTTASGLAEEEYKYRERSAYLAAPTPPPTSHILLEASKNPSFPKLTVVKPYSESPNVATRKEHLNGASQPTVTSVSSQIARWDKKQDYTQDQGPKRQHLPSDRPQGPGRTNHCGPRSQYSSRPHHNRTTMPGYIAGTRVQGPGSAVTMVTATASVTVAVHPSLPGSYRGYTHEGFDDSESDCFEETLGTSQARGKAADNSKRSTLELQDLECEEKRQHPTEQALGGPRNQAAKDR